MRQEVVKTFRIGSRFSCLRQVEVVIMAAGVEACKPSHLRSRFAAHLQLRLPPLRFSSAR